MKHTDGKPWKDDPVNHPSHYTRGKIETIDGLESAVEGLQGKEAGLTWQVIKYMWRWKFKGNPLQDLNKAKWFLDRLIDHITPKKVIAYECCKCGTIFDMPDTFTHEILCPVCGAGAKEVGELIEGELDEQSKL